MLSRKRVARRRAEWGATILALLTLGSVVAVSFAGGFIQSAAVGGISIDRAGILAPPKEDDMRKLLAIRESVLQEVPGTLQAFTPMRMVSLKALDAAIAQHRAAEPTPLPQEIQFLAGLQRIEYIFVYPERNDIVIAGPAEGWQMDRLGNYIGKTTGQPVLSLDDLMIAMRGAEATNGAGIYCSIDPTAEGVQRLNGLLSQLRTIGNPQQTMASIEQALGPQMVTVQGVPETSHFARVLVAADFRMKRIAMGFDPSPIDKLQNYLTMVGATARGPQSAMPRWWLAAKYEPVKTDGKGLAFHLPPAAVECLTEQDIVAADGTRQASGKSNPQAERWAKQMTENFDELAKVDSTFAQLRSMMDLAVAAAVLKKEGLVEFANLQIPGLMETERVEFFNAPKQVASQASFVKRGSNWIISASGGVKFQPWLMADNLAETPDVLAVRETATPRVEPTKWWWDARR